MNTAKKCSQFIINVENKSSSMDLNIQNKFKIKIRKKNLFEAMEGKALTFCLGRLWYICHWKFQEQV